MVPLKEDEVEEEKNASEDDSDIKHFTREELISLEALNFHVNTVHPKKLVNGKSSNFGICDSLGSLALARCCKGETTDMARKIGIGPAMFLMSTKALAWLFFVLSVVNIPVILFYKISFEENEFM
jgi:hypothetical protein